MKTINELHNQWEKTGKCIFCSKGKLKGFVVDKQDDNDDELFLNEKSVKKGFYDVEDILDSDCRGISIASEKGLGFSQFAKNVEFYKND